MKKIVCSEEARSVSAVERWSAKQLAKRLGVSLTYRESPEVSDQEIELWEALPEPWNTDAEAFALAFLERHHQGR